jgi:hypothetical protein
VQFTVPIDLPLLGAYLPRFVGLVGLSAWDKRAQRLLADAKGPPAASKVAVDYHWLELELAHLRRRRQQLGRIPAQIESAQTRPALHFAAAAVEISRSLSPEGQKLFQGRLRAALTAPVGFSPLYFEVSIATNLMNEGYDVEFSDIERQANFDFLASRDGVTCEIECKTLSADAGRKIHRKDFYRFMALITPQIEARANTADSDDVWVITVADRFPSGDAEHKELRSVLTAALSGNPLTVQSDSYFSLRHDSYKTIFGNRTPSSDRDFYAQCRTAYGDDCHVFGGQGTGGTCLIVMRSLREDDHSRPLLDSMRKAVTQFSGTRASFICCQFDDIEATDLATSHLRRRMEILSRYVLRKPNAAHVAATYFSGYSIATSPTPGSLASAAVCLWNPDGPYYHTAGLPFRGHIPDLEFVEVTARSRQGKFPTEGRGMIPSSNAWRRRRRD